MKKKSLGRYVISYSAIDHFSMTTSIQHNPPSYRPILQSDRMYLRVLGCASAKPTLELFPTAQSLHLRDKIFLIDCGEGAQRQMLRYHVSFANLHRIFLSHLHGDHCLGLPGLLCTMSLYGFTHPVHIYGPKGTAKFVQMIIDLFCTADRDRIIPHEVDHTTSTLIYEDRSLTVETIPLKHRVPTVGYLFREKPLARHLDRASADFYEVPVSHFARIKAGSDYTKPNGEVIPNARLTKPARRPFSYAFCSDTAYSPSVAKMVHGVDLLYHEATFSRELQERASETLHSSSTDAARVAHEAEVGHLLIGHYSGRYLTRSDRFLLLAESREVFPLTLAADDGLLIDFKELRDQLTHPIHSLD